MSVVDVVVVVAVTFAVGIAVCVVPLLLAFKLAVAPRAASEIKL